MTAWPYEGLVAAIDRGLVHDWQPIFAELRRSPWGTTARRFGHYLTYREPDGTSALFGLVLDAARFEADAQERAEVVRRVRRALDRSGVTSAEFARSIGTSPSRFSTYVTGRVVPSATLLVRIERTADVLAATSPAP